MVAATENSPSRSSTPCWESWPQCASSPASRSGSSGQKPSSGRHSHHHRLSQHHRDVRTPLAEPQPDPPTRLPITRTAVSFGAGTPRPCRCCQLQPWRDVRTTVRTLPKPIRDLWPGETLRCHQFVTPRRVCTGVKYAIRWTLRGEITHGERSDFITPTVAARGHHDFGLTRPSDTTLVHVSCLGVPLVGCL